LLHEPSYRFDGLHLREEISPSVLDTRCVLERGVLRIEAEKACSELRERRPGIALIRAQRILDGVRGRNA